MTPRKKKKEAEAATTELAVPAQNSSTHEDATSVIELIRGLQSGSLCAKALGPADRRACVEHLTADGYSVAEIAAITKLSDRTISRDREAIRKAYALSPDENFVNETIGQLVRDAETVVSRVRRFSRPAEVPPMVKIEAERTCWTVHRDLAHVLQRLGVLPNAPQMIEGALHLNALVGPDFGELSREAERLERLYAQTQPDKTDALAKIADLRRTAAGLMLEQQVTELRAVTPALPSPESAAPTGPQVVAIQPPSESTPDEQQA